MEEKKRLSGRVSHMGKAAGCCRRLAHRGRCEWSALAAAWGGAGGEGGQVGWARGSHLGPGRQEEDRTGALLQQTQTAVRLKGETSCGHLSFSPMKRLI